MADSSSRFTIKVVVSDNGSVSLAEKEISRLGSSTQRATNSARNFYDTQNKGVIGVSNSTKSFAKLAETIGRDGSSNGLVAAYATLAANIFAVTAGFNALRSASQVEQIFRGLEAAGARTGRSLITTAQSLKEVTGNAISTEQALRSTAQIVSAGFGRSEVEQLGKAARDASFALGRNMVDSLDRLTRGVVKLEPELLDELGIMTKLGEASSLYANKIGKTEGQLTNFEKRNAFLSAVLDEVKLKFGGLSDEAGNTQAYDKLSSTFSDLTNNVLSFINIIGKPIASVLSSSMLALAGASVLFASTLKKQLAPELLNLAANATNTATKLKEEAAAKRANITATYEMVKAQKQQRIEYLKNLDYIGNKGPKTYLGLRDSILEGTASAKDVSKAQTSLIRSIRANRDLVNNNPAYAPGTEARDTKLKEIRDLEKESQRLSALSLARKQAAAYDRATSSSVIEAQRQAAQAAQHAALQTQVANSIVAASNFEVVKSFTAVVAASKIYYAGLKMDSVNASSSGSVGKLTLALNGLKTASFAAGLAMRAFGAALLNAIPVIGQVLFVVGLVSTAWDALKSDKTKAIESAFDDLNQVTSKAGAQLQELKRINESSAPAYMRAAQAALLQSNAIQEVVDKVDAVRKAVNSTGSNSTPSYLQAIVDSITEFSTNTENAWSLGINKDSKALAAFSKNLSSFFRADANKEQASLIKGLDEVYNLAPKTTEEVVKYYGGWKALSQLDYAKQNATVAKILDTVRDRIGKASDQITALQQAFKALDQSIGDFTVSAAQGTKYDATVKNLDAVQLSIEDIILTATKAKEIDWKSIVQGIGPNAANLLDAPVRKQLDLVKQNDAVVQSLANSQTKLSGEDEKRLSSAREVLQSNQDLGKNLVANVERIRLQWVEAQRLERTYKSQLDLVNAHIQANQRLYAAAGAGVRARLSQEEKVRSIQIQQLESEKNIQVSLNNRIQTRIAELEAVVNTTRALYLQQEVQDNIAKGALENQLRLKGISEMQLQIIAKNQNFSKMWLGTKPNATADDKATADLMQSYYDLAQKRAKLSDKDLENARELENLQNQAKDGRAAILSLDNQIKAIREAAPTQAQKSALIQQADVEYHNTILATLREQRKTLLTVEETYSDINDIVNSTSDNLDKQLARLKRQRDAQQENARNQAKSNLAELNTRLALARADAAKPGLSAEERKAGQVAIDNIRTQISLEEQGLKISLAQIDAEYQKGVAGKVYFDTAKEGMEWQRTSLDYLQKQVDAQKDLSDNIQKGYELRSQIAAKLGNYEIGDIGKQATDIEAATRSYELAKSEVSLKKGLIDLEFTLLAAQKDQLMEELKSRRDALKESNRPQDQIRLQQLNATIDRLESVDTRSIADTAKRALDRSLEISRLELQSAILPAAKENPFSKMVGGLAQIRAREEARRKAFAELDAKVPEPLNIVKPLTEAEKAANAAMYPVANPLAGLATKIDKQINTEERLIGQISTKFSSSGNMSIQDAQSQARQFGLSITEAVGQMTGSHLGKGHHQGRAFDASIGPGKVDSTDPKLRARMDEIAKFYQSKGFVVLWNGERYDPSGAVTKLAKDANQHFDHMHVEISAAASKAMKSIQTSASMAAEQASKSIDNSDAAVDNASSQGDSKIVVTGPGKDTTKTAQKLEPIKGKTIMSATDTMDKFDAISAHITDQLNELGPQGQIVTSAVSGLENIARTSVSAIQAIRDADEALATAVKNGTASSEDYIKNFADKFTAVASIISSALSGIQSALAASATAKEDAVQREIDVEQKRDGKSAESVAKIQALEKKKDDIARKQFNTNKKLQLAQAVISTASAMAQALAVLGPIAGPILAGVVGAMGAAQIAIISSTQYQSAIASTPSTDMPSTLSIGKRGDSIDLARSNINPGGEIGYLRGTQGTGSNSGNYKVIGSAYGGTLGRGYGNAGFLVGEKGPEILRQDAPMVVKPAGEVGASGTNLNATFHINAIDSKSVAEMLHSQRGNIISMLREAANANGDTFLENVDVNVYTRPQVSKL